MINLFRGFKQWLRQAQQGYHEARAAKRAQMLDQLSCSDINVTEFNGRIYISYGGVPIVRVEDLKVKAPELLEQARRDYLDWKDKFNS